MHLWTATLDVAPTRLDTFQHHLSEDERARVDRFHFRKHRDSFVAARGILREILSGYTHEDPARLRFRYGRYGKPMLIASSTRGTDIRFNLTHSGSLLLIAIAMGRELGVDLEQIQPTIVNDRLIKEVFSEQEQVVFYSVTKSMQVPLFFDWWTRKEAYLKARGVGLSIPLTHVRVFPTLDVGVSTSGCGINTNRPRWSINPLNVKLGYSACLVVEGTGWELKSFSVNEVTRHTFSVRMGTMDL